ncbi:LysE family translocator [Photobacterium rosenbergii]|uniref:LysE family translocator n=1 Tax=Photobacterium rosenbergii TaxID=294936 RepID=UPI001C99495D|nr:LysE family translocator [Photobacterium rosenbergii]MBY5945201.1 LysE family translocator [Photobacterium rosenbergii]
MELISLALLGILIVISPGADFVLVLKNSIGKGRQAGLWTAAGISAAIFVHISYSMLGMSYLISQNEMLFNAIRYAGSGYLVYLGIKGLMTANEGLAKVETDTVEKRASRYFLQGFLCNVLNPKTMLFFLSSFSQLVAPDNAQNSPAFIYGGYMVALHGIWFCLVAIIFTSVSLQSTMQRLKKRLNQACGAGLIAFGSLLAFQS